MLSIIQRRNELFHDVERGIWCDVENKGLLTSAHTKSEFMYKRMLHFYIWAQCYGTQETVDIYYGNLHV